MVVTRNEIESLLCVVADVIETLANEGTTLKWDPQNNWYVPNAFAILPQICDASSNPALTDPFFILGDVDRYEVLDGAAFEAAFNELRYARGGRANANRSIAPICFMASLWRMMHTTAKQYMCRRIGGCNKMLAGFLDCVPHNAT